VLRPTTDAGLGAVTDPGDDADLSTSDAVEQVAVVGKEKGGDEGVGQWQRAGHAPQFAYGGDGGVERAFGAGLQPAPVRQLLELYGGERGEAALRLDLAARDIPPARRALRGDGL